MYLKVAFNWVNRKVLIKAMRRKGIKEDLVKRVEETLRETWSRVKAGGEMGKEFWTARWVRQECSLRPLLFSILIADIEKKMGKIKLGGKKIGREKIYLL